MLRLEEERTRVVQLLITVIHAEAYYFKVCVCFLKIHVVFNAGLERVAL